MGEDIIGGGGGGGGGGDNSITERHVYTSKSLCTWACITKALKS